MKMISKILGLALVLSATHAAELGAPAGELKIAKWVKGEPVTLDNKGIYVVEFWATWCPPCRTSIPHLTEMQRRFKDKGVVFIGISDERENVVAPFVKNMGDKMDYRVALDDARKTSAAYMKAYGVNGIPHAFVVQDKKVVWHGHPMGGLDKALEEVTSGKFNLEKAKASFRAQTLMQEFQEAVAEGNDAEADKLAKELTAAAKNPDSPLKDFDPARARREIQTQALGQRFRAAVYSGNEKEASELGAKIKAIDPEADLEGIRKQMAIHKLAGEYLESLTEGQTPKKDKGLELAEVVKGQAMLGNEIAWQILTNPQIAQRDVPLAARIARQACEDSKWEAASIIDTYARALFDSGKKDEAVKMQEKAVAAADEDEKSELEGTLAAYRQGKLPAAAE